MSLTLLPLIVKKQNNKTLSEHKDVKQYRPEESHNRLCFPFCESKVNKFIDAS